MANSTDPRLGTGEFLDLAARSRLLSEERVSAIREKLRSSASAAALADQLVNDGELTSFQAKKLLAGLASGLVIGRFRILKPIGRGGMGVVYLAEDTAGKAGRTQVALKILPPKKAAAEPRTRARFLREVSIGRDLPKAENIARVYETGIVDGVAFIAMEYVPGRTVKSVVTSQGALTIDVAARVFRGVALGLAAAHEKGFIHRDVKPSNIMITPDGTAKLVDFGFALRVNESNSDPAVVGGGGYTLGTFDFIPPEQALNAAAVTPQADQYSLGCSLYYALTAQLPFPGGNAKEKMQRHRWEDPVPLASLRPDLPVEFTTIVERLMAKTPSDRFPSSQAAAKALQAWAKPQTGPPTPFSLEEFTGEDDIESFASPSVRRRVYRPDRGPVVIYIGISVLLVLISAAAIAILISKR